jgi:hypothetical protein
MAAGRLGFLVLAAMLAPAATQARTVIPIHGRTLTDGVRRYSVPLTVDGQAIEAALDTGSTGLRVLPMGGETSVHGRHVRYVFSGGVELQGAEAAADLALGDLHGRADVQRVTTIGCIPARPDCAASLGLQDYGFEGDGLPGQGFRAILGLSLAAGAKDHPLRRLGARRWIVSLPMGAADGELVIDPSEEEVAGFVLLPLKPGLAWRRDGAHDSIDGCLQSSSTSAKACGAVLLDSGAAGAAVVNAGGDDGAWTAGATLTFAGQALPPVTLSRVSAGPGADLPRPMILAGAEPYLAFDVLYDPERRMIGLRVRSRSPAGHGPKS